MTDLPSSIVVFVSTLRAAQGALGLREVELLEGATTTRRREFTAGRVLAHRALAQIGLDQTDIGRAPSGAPIWPLGSCGSITHTATHAAVAVAPRSYMRSVGIDIDDGRDLDSAIENVAASSELRALASHPLVSSQAEAGRLAFCAKEALYKCQAPLTGNDDLGFTDVVLHLDRNQLVRAEPVGTLDHRTLSAIDASRIFIKIIQGVSVAVAWISANI